MTFAEGIDPQGDIVGGYQNPDGTFHGLLLSDGGVASESAAPAMPGQTTESPKVVLPYNVRKLLQRRLPLGRFGAGLMRP